MRRSGQRHRTTIEKTVNQDDSGSRDNKSFLKSNLGYDNDSDKSDLLKNNNMNKNNSLELRKQMRLNINKCTHKESSNSKNVSLENLSINDENKSKKSKKKVGFNEKGPATLEVLPDLKSPAIRPFSPANRQNNENTLSGILVNSDREAKKPP